MRRVVKLLCVCVALSPTATIAQQQVSDAELRSAYCYAALPHSIADGRSLLDDLEAKLGELHRLSYADQRKFGITDLDDATAKLRWTYNRDIQNLERLKAHLLATNTLRKGAALLQASTRGEADYQQCRNELKQHVCVSVPASLESPCGEQR